MTTGWLITLGYVSGATYVLSRQSAEAFLYEAAFDTARHEEDILSYAEQAKYCPRKDEFDNSLRDYAHKFSQMDDLTIGIKAIRDRAGDVVETSILLLASGGGLSRAMKECTRRAYVRLLMEQMHFRGLDIQVSVT